MDLFNIKQIPDLKIWMTLKVIKCKGIDYDREDVTFTGYVFKLNTPQFNVVKRSADGKGTNFMQEIVEYHRQNW